MSLRPLQMAVCALVGAVIGGATVYQIGPDPIQRALAAALSSFKQVTRSEAPVAPPPSEKERQRAVAEQAQASASRDEQARQLRADQQKASGGAGSAALEAAAHKERAWTRFYKRPSQCEGNPTAEAMTECANHYIRSKRQFDEAYAAGKR